MHFQSCVKLFCSYNCFWYVCINDFTGNIPDKFVWSVWRVETIYYEIIRPSVHTAFQVQDLDQDQVSKKNNFWTKCTICNVLQDEFHFVIECNLFKDLRNRYISRYVWLHPNYFKFTQLLVTHNEADIKKLSIFVFKAFERLVTFNRIFWTHIHV